MESENLVVVPSESELKFFQEFINNKSSEIHIFGIHIHSMFLGYFGFLKNNEFVTLDAFWDTSFAFIDPGSINIIKPEWSYYTIPHGHLGLRSQANSGPNSKFMPQKSFFVASTSNDITDIFDKIHLVEHRRLSPNSKMDYATITVNKLEFQEDGSTLGYNIIQEKIHDKEYDIYIDIP